MSLPLVAVLGAYGVVGREVVTCLRNQMMPIRLRLGGQRAELLTSLINPSHPDDELCVTHAFDAMALERLCAGCNVVINCAGPSHRLFDVVARAALAAGADYVDPAGAASLHARLTELTSGIWHDRRVLLSAGMLPGLSGILPRWLARNVAPGASLRVYIGVLDHLSIGAAEDYLNGITDNESLASWQDGQRTVGATQRLSGVDLPPFPAGLIAHPYLHDEGERVARELSLSDARFYNLFDGAHMLAVLARVVDRQFDAVQLTTTARELVRAVELDLAGRTPYLRYLLQLDGVSRGIACSRTLMVCAPSAAGVTGAVVALAAQALLAGEVPPGTHYAAEILEPQLAVQRLRESTAVSGWQFLDRAPHDAVIEEGTL